MRPQQQNRRMRGRGGGGSNNNNNRKGPNPLTRSYESNGPDVKIRGTAQQVAEKYTTLARDAQSSGDRVMAENYLQHAEHYNRIIATALAQQQQLQQQQREGGQDDIDGDDDDRGERDQRQPESQQPQAQPQYHANGFGPQPVIEDTQPTAFDAVNSDESAAPSNGGSGPRRENGEAPRRARRPRRSMQERTQRAEGGEEGQAAEAEAPPTPEAAE